MHLQIEVPLSQEQVKAACQLTGCADPGDALREFVNLARQGIYNLLDDERGEAAPLEAKPAASKKRAKKRGASRR